MPESRPPRIAFALLLGVLLGASSLPLLAQSTNTQAARFYEDALVRFEKKDNAGAVIQLKNSLKIDNKQLAVHMLLGKALLAQGEASAAEAAFSEALKLGVNPIEVVLPLAEAVTAQGNPELLLSQARFSHGGLPADLKSKLLLLKAAAASDTGQTRDALKFLEEARSVDVGGADAWAAEVPIRIRARQLAEARTAADKAVALDPLSPRAAYQQATVAHVRGDLKQALALYTRTLQLKADHGDALVARAGIYLDLGQAEQAAKDVKAARQVSPSDPRATYLGALLAEARGDRAEAKKLLAEVTNLIDPIPIERLKFRPQLLMLGGMSHFGLDQFVKAQPYLEAVVGQAPDSPVAKLLARIYLRESSLDKAIETLDNYLSRQPDDTQARALQTATLMSAGRFARAAQLADQGLKKSDDTAMRALMGISLVNSGKLQTGVSELEAVYKRDPGQIQAGAVLANLYIASGQAARAVEIADALFKRRPSDAQLANLVGSARAAKGDVPAARAAFEQALKLAPAFAEPMLNLARIEIDFKQFDPALKRLTALLAKDEKNTDYAIEMARLSSARGDADEALRWLQRADDNSGQRLGPTLQLVDFHLARGRPDLARPAVARLQGKAPETLAVLLATARVQLANKEFTEARTVLTRATTVASYDAAALTQIGDLQARAGNPTGAAHALDKALSERPEHLRARVLRSNVYLIQGDPAKAEAMARSVLASHPKSGLGHALLGDVAMYRKQLPAAVESYRRAHAVEQSTQSLLRLFGALESAQRPAAMSLASDWLRSRPDDAAVWRALGDAEARVGNLAAARTAYERLVRQLPNDAETLNNLAVVLVDLKDPSALEVADRALKLKPDVAYVLGTTGWAAFHAGKADRALQLLRDARLRDPSHAGIRYYLGAVLAQQGRKVEAREELEAAVRLGAGTAYARDAGTLLKAVN